MANQRWGTIIVIYEMIRFKPRGNFEDDDIKMFVNWIIRMAESRW